MSTPAKVWLFHNGDWTEIDNPLVLTKEETIDFEASGYEPVSVGLGILNSNAAVDVYSANKNPDYPVARYRFFIWWTLGGIKIFVNDAPSLVQVLGRLTRIVDTETLSQISFQLEQFQPQPGAANERKPARPEAEEGFLMNISHEQRENILIHWSEENQAYIASFPGHPTIYTQGTTRQEALRNAEEVLEMIAAHRS